MLNLGVPDFQPQMLHQTGCLPNLGSSTGAQRPENDHNLGWCSQKVFIMLPSGYVKIAIENGPVIVDLPIKNGDFQ